MTSRVFLGTSGKHRSHFMDMCLSYCHGCRTMKGNKPNHMTRVAREGFSQTVIKKKNGQHLHITFIDPNEVSS